MKRVKLPGGGSMPPPTFKNFITELASTALVCLGVLDSPITKTKIQDLERAKHLIDLLAMLEQKTKGNLEVLEADYLEAVLEDLREKYSHLAGETSNPADSDEPDEPDEPDIFGR